MSFHGGKYMRTIYNEGRVVGLSAYESYVRSQLAAGVDPNDIKSESEWSSALMTNARGGSMVLKITAGTTAGYHDYELPTGTTLCPNSPLYATLFEGDVDLIDLTSVWASHITNNGRLISNDSSSYPITPGTASDVPVPADPEVMSTTYREQCVEYMKINSGIAVQPGEWTQSGVAAPEMKLSPDFSQPGFVRLAFVEDISADFYILINGFMTTELLGDAVTVEDFSQTYLNGEALGPAAFPWASKIQLLMTTDSLKGYLDWYLDATLTTDEYNALPVKENKFYFTRKSQ